MSNTQYPIKLKCPLGFLYELYHCEYGRWEDAQTAREAGDADAIVANDYQVVACDFLDRHHDLSWVKDTDRKKRATIEVQNDAELHELYYVLASGTIGLYLERKRVANRLLDEIRDDVRKIDPQLVKNWPCQNGM